VSYFVFCTKWAKISVLTWSPYLTNNMCSIEAELGGGMHIVGIHTLIAYPTRAGWFSNLGILYYHYSQVAWQQWLGEECPLWTFYLRTQQSAVENLNWCSNMNNKKRSLIVVQLLRHVQNKIVNNARPSWNSHGLMEHKFSDTCFSFGIRHMVRSVVNNG